MGKNRSNFSYRIMSLFLSLRSISRKPKETLEKIGIKSGHIVLDYGAGPGVYSIPAAKLVGKSGKVYSADIHPKAKTHFLDYQQAKETMAYCEYQGGETQKWAVKQKLGVVLDAWYVPLVTASPELLLEFESHGMRDQ